MKRGMELLDWLRIEAGADRRLFHLQRAGRTVLYSRTRWSRGMLGNELVGVNIQLSSLFLSC